MWEVNQLTFAYDDKKTVLDQVSFKIETGKIYCLLGVNGSGKTTLFNCLSGFLKSNYSLDKYFIDNKLLYIQDEMHFYKNLSGLEFTELIFSLKDKKFDLAEFDRLLSKLKMNDYKNERISAYSLGTKQKLVLIIGILLNYQYIIMDEPFAAIDFIAAEVINDVLKELKEQGKAIIVSTHQLDIAQELADEILFLNDGKVNQIINNFQTPRELKNYIRLYI
ncbi:ABC-2 type transport system ATP-binding protein [Natronobacillus azotifigens]|uniref:ABC transporter ATP-binding protein n=1 Tax=Natronobacillus azotifigens TaxID=472978 RepID=A0A9J6RBT1_9BACI|nr:ABC transporter ATP-binding protein [Natronobacillus azotifigens]MCZ0702787.1 ABC transporter ATP-binding protein [Natronobacillus azotifigens]